MPGVSVRVSRRDRDRGIRKKPLEKCVAIFLSVGFKLLKLEAAAKMRSSKSWYYRNLADTFREMMPGQLSDELHEIVEALEA